MRSINNVETRTQVLMTKDEFKEALIQVATYENPRNFIVCFSSKDMESYANGNLIGKLIILENSGYIILKYSKLED